MKRKHFISSLIAIPAIPAIAVAVSKSRVMNPAVITVDGIVKANGIPASILSIPKEISNKESDDWDVDIYDSFGTSVGSFKVS